MLLTLFMKLLIGHTLADFVLQSEFMSAAKNRHTTPYKDVPWWIIMSYHCLIHAAMVSIVAGSWSIGVLEFIVHFMIDTWRCDKEYSFLVDQVLHILFKVLWAWIIWMFYITSLS